MTGLVEQLKSENANFGEMLEPLEAGRITMGDNENQRWIAHLKKTVATNLEIIRRIEGGLTLNDPFP